MKLGYIEWINATAIFPVLFSLKIKLFTYMPKRDFYHVEKSEIKICTMVESVYYLWFSLLLDNVVCQLYFLLH